jgi:hypothetical protein
VPFSKDWEFVSIQEYWACNTFTTKAETTRVRPLRGGNGENFRCGSDITALLGHEMLHVTFGQGHEELSLPKGTDLSKWPNNDCQLKNP